MGRKVGRLYDIRATCTWPCCDRGPDLSVEYERGRDRGPWMAWLPKGARAGVNLCAPHADEFADALGTGRILKATPLPPGR